MDDGATPDAAEQRSRTLVVWCPDWPAVAAARQAGRPASDPVAVFHANRVQACTTAARAEGIHVGQRRRDAQSRCPDLLVAQVDLDRDGRLFEPVAAAVEFIAPGVEILRSGVVACPARGPRRYFGTDIAAAERIVDVVEALDIECSVGVADVLAVAVLAAHRGMIVPPGGSAEFCAALPITELARDPAISPPERAALADLLIRLGITTAGAFAALPEGKVATRFGADGVQAHRLARGLAERGVSRRQIPEELTVEQICDPPLERVDTAAFAARALAERFHSRLADAGLACTRLAITAVTERDTTLTRVWRCAAPLTAAATADRLRWQLDGWLTAGRTAVGPVNTAQNGGPGAIIRLVLEPVEAVGAGRIQYGLWGSDGQDDQRAGWAFARVQGLLGPESVLAPVRSGGRSAVDRVALVPWGDEKVSSRSPKDPWPGSLPAPSPTRVTVDSDSDPDPLSILDDAGHPVQLTGRGQLTGSPAWLGHDGQHQHIDAWAGPWLLDERWWSADRRPTGARVQIVTAAGVALLMRLGPAGWTVEGVYD
ncbi:MAG TPA: DNA polymerase Y family protein [Nakamurella sp.]